MSIVRLEFWSAPYYHIRPAVLRWMAAVEGRIPPAAAVAFSLDDEPDPGASASEDPPPEDFRR